MECGNWLRVGQRVGSTLLTAKNDHIQRRAQNNIVKWRGNPLEGLQKPRADYAIHHDKIAALGVAFGNTCEHIHDHGVLFMRLGQIWRDGTVFDEVPEVVRMKMNLGRFGFFGKGLCGCSLP